MGHKVKHPLVLALLSGINLLVIRDMLIANVMNLIVLVDDV